jgi:hypothetical protein
LCGVQDPQTLIARLRSKGIAVHTEDMALPAGQAVQVDVPEKGLALLFVTAQVCRSVGSR